MNPPGRTARIALIVLGLLTLLVLAVALVLPPLMSARIESQLREKLESRGIWVASLDARLRSDGQAVVERLCVNDLPPYEDEKLACVSDLVVNVALFRALRGDLAIQAVKMDSLEVWLPRTRGSLPDSAERWLTVLSRSPEEDDDSASDASSRGGLLGDLRDLKVDAVKLHLEGHPGVRGEQRVSEIRGGARADGREFALSAELRGAFELPAVGEATVDANAPGPVTIDVVLDLEQNSLEAASLKLDAPATVTARWQGTEMHASFTGVAFEAPYSIAVLDPSATIADRLAFEAPRVVFEAGAWPADWREFFLARVTLESPTIELASFSSVAALGEVFRSKAAVLDGAQADEPLAEAGSSAGDVDPSAGGEGVADSSPGAAFLAAIREELASRKWWEILPRNVAINDGIVRVKSDEERPTFELAELSATYAMRYIRFQMDAQAQTTLYVGANRAGSLRFEGIWNYQDDELDAQFGARALDLGAFFDGLVRDERLSLDGQLDVVSTIAGTPENGFSLSATGALTEPMLDAPLFSEAYATPDISFELGGRLAERHDDTKPPGWALHVASEKLSIGDVSLGAGLTLYALGQGLLTRRADVVFEIPDQPAMKLMGVLPPPMLGPLQGTEMRGDFGMTLKFPVEFARDDDGDVRITIDGPTTYDFRDGELSLVSLPEEVDVRRLNHAMEFVFRGPEDSVMRRMRIPPPSLIKDYPGISETNETPPGWTRLRGISFYLIAAQLYREDGSFFRNSGVNWYQLRRVAAEAIENRRLGRGASTITMQLVKNLFLSHERSIERKVQEVFLSYWMTRLVPKERILEVYLNIIEWGPNLNGVDEAAEFYFHKTPAELGLVESAWLSSITPNPVVLGGKTPRVNLSIADCRRCRWIIEGLASRGWISRMEANLALEGPLPAPTTDVTLSGNRAFDDEPGVGTQTGFGGFASSRPFGGPAKADSSTRLPGIGGSDAEGDGGNDRSGGSIENPEDVEAPSDFQLLSPNQRITEWVNESRRLRGN